jgi:hypothetical protein
MTKAGLLFGAALALTVTAAPGQEIDSANFMLPHCQNYLDSKSNDDLYQQGVCSGIVRTISLVGTLIKLDKSEFPSVSNGRFQQFACLDIPDKVSIRQTIRVVVAYIEARPARMHEDFTGLTIEALHAA